jgi:hypothetical protein
LKDAAKGITDPTTNEIRWENEKIKGAEKGVVYRLPKKASDIGKFFTTKALEKIIKNVIETLQSNYNFVE